MDRLEFKAPNVGGMELWREFTPDERRDLQRIADVVTAYHRQQFDTWLEAQPPVWFTVHEVTGGIARVQLEPIEIVGQMARLVAVEPLPEK